MSSISSSNSTRDKEAKPNKVYYSARGGARSKGAEDIARTQVPHVSPTALEVPLPRGTATHYLRGGSGNERQHAVEEGALERSLANDRLRLKELKWQPHDTKVAKTGLRGGARIPTKKEPKDPEAKKTRLVFRRRAGSTSSAEASGSLHSPTSSSDFSLSPVSTRDSTENPLERRMYELSIGSSIDEEGSIALSNFTAPTFLNADDDDDDNVNLQRSSSKVSIASTIGQQRARPLTLSSDAADNPS